MQARLISTLILLTAAGGACLGSGTAFAHHSFALFDRTKTVTIEGPVKQVEWGNPHVWITLAVADAATGKPIVWNVECASIIELIRQGWTRNSLKAGDTAKIVLNPLHTGQIGGSLVSASVNGTAIGRPWGAK